MNRKDNTMYNLLDNLKALRPLLPKGYTTIIAKEMGVTNITVSNALLGRTRRFDIIERAIELAEANKNIAIRLKNVVSK